MEPGGLKAVRELNTKFKATGDVVYKNLAIGLGLMHMSLAFHGSYLKSQNPDDLERAITLVKQALALVPPGDNAPRAVVLTNYGKLLSMRFERFRTVDDLNRAIDVSEAAAVGLGPDNPERSFILWNLGAMCGTRYQFSGGIEDLSQAIKWAEEAVTATPSTHPERPSRLNNVGILLLARSKETTSLADLERAIEISEEALASTEITHPIRPALLNNLGMIFQHRHTHQGQKDDINKAIVCLQQAVQTGARGHPEYTLNLGIMVITRYKQFEGAEDLEFAIQCAGDAVAAMPREIAIRPTALCNLAQMITIRHTRFGAIEDLERAMELTEEGIKATHPTNPELPLWQHNLAVLYYGRYRHFGAVKDLRNAIESIEAALAACPLNHLRRAGFLSCQAILLERMGQRPGELGYLDKAVQVSKSAVLAAPADGPDRGDTLHNLAYVLSQRFNQSHSVEDLDLAICRAEEARSQMSTDSANLWKSNRLLARLCYLRYERFTEKDNLVRAIELCEECVAMVPPDHIERSYTLFSLATMVDSRYRLSRTRQDFFYGLRLLYEAWYCHAAPPQHRIVAAVLASAYLARKRMWQEASSLLGDAIKMIPKIDMRSTSMSDQSYRVSSCLPPEIIPTFVSVSLKAGEEVSQCLRLLELARGLIIGHAIDCRSDLSELRLKHPEIADRFHRLRVVVDSPLSEMEMKCDIPQSLFQQDQRKRERVVSDLEQTITSIRELSGFEGFHLPPRSEELIGMAAHGPIIVVSSSEWRSDAIIVTRSAIKSIPLNLSGLLVNEQMQNIGKAIRGRRPTYADRNKKMGEILEWLWVAIVEPIFSELDLKPVANTRDLPRVWWIGIGCLSIAPFHAAGYHGPRSTQNTMSRAISTYTPTIKALKYTRRKGLVLLMKPDPRILMITMPTTPDKNWKELPNAAIEAKQIEDLVSGKASITLLDHPSAACVLAQLPAHDAIHFACHGVSDHENPSTSSLLLQGDDGKLDRLTVQSISHIHMDHAQIAYLSACSTAENSSAELMNESIFIASGFQLAGFSHVLATQWESNDEACRQVSGDFYKLLFDGKPGGGDGSDGGHRKVGVSFHQAVKKLRQVNRRQPLKWASFIHTGA